MSDIPRIRPALQLLQGGREDVPLPPTSIRVPAFPAPPVPKTTVQEIRANETPRERKARQERLRKEDNLRVLRGSGLPTGGGT